MEHCRKLFISILFTITSCESIYDEHFIKIDKNNYKINSPYKSISIDCEDCITLEMRISNNPFQLDSTYHMEIYFPYNNLVYSGIYKDKCLLKIPRSYFGQEIMPNINITNNKFYFRGARKEHVFSLKSLDKQQGNEYLIFTFLPDEDPCRNYSIRYAK
ncbi:MAG: hypothetical protein MUC49_20320 [Raineya sp.]|jgi:hypothetical protein|nr:hypothetical protein [Raineya sp.]